MNSRRFSRRSLMAAGFGAAVGAAAASMLAACGEDEAETDTMTETMASDAGERETVTIEYLNWAFSEVGEGPAAEILDAFHAAVPHIQVEPQNLGFTQAQDKMITLHAAGALPDAIQIGFWQIGDFWDQGMIREVESMANAANFDWSDYAEPLKNRIGNEIVVVPMSTITGLTHYNEGTFEAAGVDGPPDNWDEHIEIGKQITDPDAGQYGISHAWSLENPQVYSHLYPQIWQAGGEVENDDDLTFEANTSEGLAALSYVLDMELKEGMVAPGSLNGTEQTLIENFGSGLSGMFYDNSAHFNGYLEREDLSFFVGPPLEGPARRSGFTFGWRNSIADRTEHPQETFDFLAWIAGVEGNSLLAGLGNQVPANKNATPTYSEGKMSGLVSEAVKWATFEGAQGSEGLGDERLILVGHIHDAINGTASYQEVLDRTETEWNESVSG